MIARAAVPAGPRSGYVVAMPMLSTILFDLDGTLIDSVRLILDSYHHTLAAHGLPARTDAEWLRGVGTPLSVQFAPWKEHPGIEAMIATYRDYNLRHHDACVTVYPGVVDMVRAVKARGLATGLVTSKNRSGAQRGLRLCGIEELMDVIVGADEVTHPKPHPEPVLKAMGCSVPTRARPSMSVTARTIWSRGGRRGSGRPRRSGGPSVGPISSPPGPTTGSTSPPISFDWCPARLGRLPAGRYLPRPPPSDEAGCMRLLPRDEKFFDLFTAVATLNVEAARLLQDLLRAGPAARRPIVDPIKRLEHQADQITHDVVSRLDRIFITPLDREDIHHARLPARRRHRPDRRHRPPHPDLPCRRGPRGRRHPGGRDPPGHRAARQSRSTRWRRTGTARCSRPACR